MRITIIGAGILGKDLASTLSNEKHDVVLIDKKTDVLDNIRNHIDVMTCAGNGASATTLKRANISDSDVLIAVTGDEAANILACQLARHFGVKNTLCRLSGEELFSPEDGIMPDTLGLDNIVVPELECVSKIIDVVKNHAVLEKIRFSNPNAVMTAFEIKVDSPLCKMRISEIPDKDLISKIRIAAIIRNGLTITPRGNTILRRGDELFIAGHRDNVQQFIDWSTETTSKPHRIIIAGGTIIGQQLASRLADQKYKVRLIDIDRSRGEQLLDEFGSKLMVICGDTTEKEVLEEAGIEECDIFISALKDDEDNILSCILAKKMGAKKVITITNKSEYIDIVPSIPMINCGFSAGLVASNSVLRNFLKDKRSVTIEATLHRLKSYIYEFTISDKSPCCGHKVEKCSWPTESTIALVFRGEEVLSASGNLTLQSGDIVATIASQETLPLLEPLFSKKGRFL